MTAAAALAGLYWSSAVNCLLAFTPQAAGPEVGAAGALVMEAGSQPGGRYPASHVKVSCWLSEPDDGAPAVGCVAGAVAAGLGRYVAGSRTG